MGSKNNRRHANRDATPNTDTPQADSVSMYSDDELPFVSLLNMFTGMGAVIEGMERMMLPKLREVIYTEPMLVVSVVCRCGINQGATYQTSPDEIYALLTHAVHCVGGES